MITGIVAIAQNGVIGNEHGMPWPRDAEDLAFFKAQTMGKPCIVGRKTFEHMEELGVKWGTRTPFVVSRSGKKGCFLDIHQAFYQASHLSDQIMVIGGGQVFWNTMRYMDNLIVTHIEGEYEGTAFFHPEQSLMWQKICQIGRRSVFTNKKYKESPWL